MASTAANANLDISAVISQFGRYYIPGGQGVKDLTTKLFRRLQSETYIGTSRRKEDASKVRFGRVTVDEVTQAFQPRWTPKGLAKFLPNEFDIEHVKIEYDFTMDDELVESWLGFLSDTGNDVRSWPIIRYILETIVIPQHQEDRELKMIYTGVRVDPTLGTAGPAVAAVTGFEKRIVDALANSNPLLQANLITMGAVPTTGSTLAVLIVNYIEDFVKQIPDLVRERMEPIRVSPTIYALFAEGMATKYNTYWAQIKTVEDKDSDEPIALRFFPRVKIAKSYAQTGKTRMWSCEQGNSVIAMRGANNENVFSLEKFSAYTASAYTNYWLTYGFKYNGAVWTTDVS